jgi:hypothetical protein
MPQIPSLQRSAADDGDQGETDELETIASSVGATSQLIHALVLASLAGETSPRTPKPRPGCEQSWCCRTARSIERGNLVVADMAARDLGQLSLEEALRLVVLYAEAEPTKFERAALERPVCDGAAAVAAQGSGRAARLGDG